MLIHILNHSPTSLTPKLLATNFEKNDPQTKAANCIETTNLYTYTMPTPCTSQIPEFANCGEFVNLYTASGKLAANLILNIHWTRNIVGGVLICCIFSRRMHLLYCGGERARASELQNLSTRPPAGWQWTVCVGNNAAINQPRTIIIAVIIIIVIMAVV